MLLKRLLGPLLCLCATCAMAQPEPLNILVIILDTTRADHLSGYGYERPTTPNIDAFSKTARRYTNAYSTSAWTVPAHASMLTGLHGITHGATQENWRLAPELDTLPELLKPRGYHTVAICENAMLTQRSGFAQGFDEYYEPRRMKQPAQSASLSLDLFRQTVLEKNRPPFFCFVNLIAPHSPYEDHPRHVGTFVTGERLPVRANLWRQFYLGRKHWSEKEIAYMKVLYDSELLFADHVTGLMIDALREAEQLDNTLVIITSDHGETFGEHAHFDHVFNLYEELVRVPLIVHYPGAEACVDARPVQVSDIFPTALRAANLTPPHAAHRFAEDLIAGPGAVDRPLYMEYFWPKQALRGFNERDRDDPKLAPYKRTVRAVRRENLKYIEGSEGRRELYDLREDPREQNNLADSEAHAPTVAQLKALLDDFTKTGAAGKTGDSGEEGVAIDEAGLDEDVLDALRSLGYLE